jgi:hypothetical protein
MFIQFLILGMFLGIVYDIFRLIRIGRKNTIFPLRKRIKKRYFKSTIIKDSKISIRKLHFDTFLVFAEDISFFLIVAITEILATYHLNDGEIRIYCLLFSLVGFAYYQKTIGLFVFFLLRKFLRLFKKCLFICLCVILDPIAFIIKKSKTILSVIKLKNEKKTKRSTKKGV